MKKQKAEVSISRVGSKAVLIVVQAETKKGADSIVRLFKKHLIEGR